MPLSFQIAWVEAPKSHSPRVLRRELNKRYLATDSRVLATLTQLSPTGSYIKELYVTGGRHTMLRGRYLKEFSLKDISGEQDGKQSPSSPVWLHEKGEFTLWRSEERKLWVISRCAFEGATKQNART